MEHKLTSLFLLLMFLGGTLLAMDNESWLVKARTLVEEGFMMDSDETSEDGFYCLMMTEISSTSSTSPEARLGVAVLEGKKKITAFIHGETVSASVSLDERSETISNGIEKERNAYSKFEKRIKTNVDALVKCIKVVGQVTANEKNYVVCLTCEKYENQTAALLKAQSEYGNEGVVSSVGEAANRDLAVQKAVRSAVEQVLGTVVIGYDKIGNDNDFQSKIFSGTNGIVETYRILSESDISIGKRIEIVAKVSKKNLLDNYTNYMKFLGNPGFYIQTDSSDLATYFTEFFTKMGIRITSIPEEASYLIVCTGKFHTIIHPIDTERNGVQLSLRFTIMDSTGKNTLIDMKNDPRKSACFIGNNLDRQMEICATKAFKQMQKPLHQKIHTMIGNLVGQKMDEEKAKVVED